MSYILEALRKSERERQLGQAPSLPVLVADAPPQRHRWLPWIVSILLLTLNVAALLYFGFGNKDSKPSETQKIVVAQPAFPAPYAEPKVVMPSSGQPATVPETPRQDLAEQEKAAVTSTLISSASINDRIAPKPVVNDAAQSTNRSVPEKASVVTPPPVADRKPLPITVQATSNKPLNDEKKPLKEKLEKSVERPEAIEVKRAAEKPVVPVLPRAMEDTVKAEVKREELPLLSAMPEDMRSRMPPLTVNMLAYTSLPKERFAVVNMVKYSSGDQLPGGAVLLEIRSDGLVLDLDGMRFRIPQR